MPGQDHLPLLPLQPPPAAPLGPRIPGADSLGDASPQTPNLGLTPNFHSSPFPVSGVSLPASHPRVPPRLPALKQGHPTFLSPSPCTFSGFFSTRTTTSQAPLRRQSILSAVIAFLPGAPALPPCPPARHPVSPLCSPPLCLLLPDLSSCKASLPAFAISCRLASFLCHPNSLQPEHPVPASARAAPGISLYRQLLL